jgi:phosphate transport system protein
VTHDTEHRVEFQDQLARLRDDVVRLGVMTCETIGKGTAALLDRDLAAAQRLIDDDDEIDVLTLEIDEACYQLLALQNPMARDLRLIMSALRMASELERSADLMVNVAKAFRRIYEVEMTPEIRGLVEDMSIEAAAITQKAIDAFVTGDAGLASALDDIDDRLDDLQRDFVEAVFSSHLSNHLDMRSAVQLALIARYYERIGDHAVNMGERISYMVTGWLPEHSGQARMEMRERQPDAD